ncbi:putative fatty-acid--CoA ligase FadD10 [Clydaea vesicula]|uniref:Fatty-acid--CoA ligase FadD10 n=1 Tax=Clydaea vesicula TaxID=447962 RepID=A0AAD5XV06_9FUNG|nr:putative fatty-acid--CoA ligase FadD10 [Clydaea vesicula]
MIFKSPFPDFPIPQHLDTVSFLFDNLTEVEKLKTALIDQKNGLKLNYSEFVNKINSISNGLLKNLKLNKWDVVGIWSPNHIDYISAVYGIVRAGLTVTTANPSYHIDEIVYQLKDSNAKALITHKSIYKDALNAAAMLNIPRERIFIFGEEKIENVNRLSDLFVNSSDFVKPNFSLEELNSKPAFLMYSSGTTGRSKGVKTSHVNMIANLLQANVVEKSDVKEGDCFLGILPIYHSYGLGYILPGAFINRISIVICEKFELKSFLETFEKYKITKAHIVSSAAPLGLEISKELYRILKVPVKQGYGMTELSPNSHGTRSSHIVDGSFGVLAPNMRARVVDVETGKDLGYNQEGELLLKGPNVMIGYLNNEKATKETIVDGWLHTGDIVKVDEGGNYFIVDRLKELIKYKGFQVAPAELEALILTHPAVADTAVVPLEQEMAGEVPRAYVVLKPGFCATEKDIKDFVSSRVANFKSLRGGVVFVDVIPKSPSGKILRRVLRLQAIEETKVYSKL